MTKLLNSSLKLRWDRLTVVFVAVVLIQAGLVALGAWGAVSYRDALAKREQSFRNVTAIDAVLVALLNAETGQRGYIITGDSGYLSPYIDGKTAVGAAIDEVATREGRYSETRALVPGLRALISEKLTEMTDTVNLRLAGDEAGARAAVQSHLGRNLMDQIRTELATLRKTETARLSANIDAASQRGLLLTVTEVAAAVVALGVIAWLYIGYRGRQDAAVARRAAVAKDEFVGFVAHELRTPIAVIAGNARLLGRAAFAEERYATSVAEISLEADRLATILDRLGRLAQAEAGQSLITEPLLVQRILPGVVATHRRRFPHREVQVALAPGLPPALGDEVAIGQIFQNLLTNAEKYGGPDSPIALNGIATATTVEISVVNAGRRLNAQDFEDVFDPFFRAPATAAMAPGIGLGLTVSHRLAQAQGGTIRAEARPEGGARFTLSLPLAPNDDGEMA